MIIYENSQIGVFRLYHALTIKLVLFNHESTTDRRNNYPSKEVRVLIPTLLFLYLY